MTQPIGPVMLDLEGPQLSNAEKTLLKDPAVGGVILF
ncbi:MAG: beta-N-acetylhexosaminidase, partial [Pseudomonadota bacterium]|nr:beta-N-acetylhexosaminidase [Pseudomonadota bacterium]